MTLTRFGQIVCVSGVGLAACLGSPTPTAGGAEPAPITVSYVVSAELVLNPERGFFTPYELPSPAGFDSIRATGNTLVHTNIWLDPWRESDLPSDLLAELNQNFAAMRAAGVKAIVRFAYNQGPYPDSEPDASKAQILRHIEQLTPLLQDNVDVIAWLEAGFIGAWGEWHTSTHGLDQSLTDKREILTALLQALPPTRMLQLRYPSDIWNLYGDPLTDAQAFTQTDQARVGHHNDCFLASDTDEGTYDREGENTIESDQARLAQLSRFTPVSGETCQTAPPRSECPTTLDEMARMHWSAINEGYHKGVIRGWNRGGCLEEIKLRLGYRLSLQSAVFNNQVRPGGILQLSVTFTNTGFASLINPRLLNIVLDGPQRYVVTLTNTDPRRWEAGQTSTFTTKLRLPANAPAGVYRLALWLPDAAEPLRDDVRYAVQFTNSGTWDEAAGYNILTESITVDPSISGDFDPAATTLTVLH